MDTKDSPYFAVPPKHLSCAMHNIANMVKDTQRYRRTVLWSVVSHAFGHGSTVSRELCRHAGLDPDSMLPNIKPL